MLQVGGHGHEPWLSVDDRWRPMLRARWGTAGKKWGHANQGNHQAMLLWVCATSYALRSAVTGLGKRVSKSRTTTWSGRTAIRPILMSAGNEPT